MGTLRAAGLLQPLGTPRLTLSDRIARLRGDLLRRTGELFSGQPQVDAVRPGHAARRPQFRGFRTGHGISRDWRLPRSRDRWSSRGGFPRIHLLVGKIHAIGPLGTHVSVIGRVGSLYRRWCRTALPYSAPRWWRQFFCWRACSFAAWICSKPIARGVVAALRETILSSRRQLPVTFLAAAIVAAVAVPWIEQTTEPWTRGLRHLQDFTRDGEFPPRVVQFRIDLRAAANWLAAKMPARFENAASSAVALPLRGALRLWEIFVISIALQAGMIALMASYFHRVTLAGPFSNIPAVLLTAAIVPALDFLTLALPLSACVSRQ